MEENPDSNVVQMDTVIGRVGGKCILIIHFVETSLMLAFLRDVNTSVSVLHIIDVKHRVLGTKAFDKLYENLLERD